MKKQSTSEVKSMLDNFQTELTVASPGRINLIGEHTDYNQGFVLPTAIDRKIYFTFRKNGEENTCRIYSETFNSYSEFKSTQLSRSTSTWENYIFGVIDEMQKRGKVIRGFDCIIKSELPVGAGISSSAALECGLASGLNQLFDLGFPKMDLVQICQDAENNFVGSNCGIMDQYASVMSRTDHLILLDCRSLEAEYIPADFKNCRILLLNTNVTHNLAEGEYNTRRKECESAVTELQKKFPDVQSLRDVNPAMLEDSKHTLSQKEYQRSRYVLEENERVLKATEAIKTGNLQEFGYLMYQSHEGLQHQYEVSCEELDFLVEHTREKDFVYGSRMMGGGFGGCTINLIEEKNIPQYIEEVAKDYFKKFKIELDAISVVPSGGTIVK